MKKLSIAILPMMLMLCSSAVLAQTPPPTKPQPPTPQAPPAQPPQPINYPCPQLNIQGPNRPMRDGDKIGFAANIGGGDPNIRPVFNWAISNGVLENGQGTRNIVVDSTGAGNDRQLIADVTVLGYSYECNNRASVTVPVAAPAKKVDEFGDLPAKDEAGKLDSIVSYLSQAPDRIYLIGYAGRTNVRGYTADVLRRMKTYLAKSPGIGERVAAIDGGFREQPSYEIWVVPIGAEGPRATPTVDRKDIVFPKPPPRTPTKKP